MSTSELINNTGRQFLPVDHEYDFNGTTLNGPSFFISFDASNHGPASNFTFSVDAQPLAVTSGAFDWYLSFLDVESGSTIFRGEVDSVTYPNNPFLDGPNIGDLFYQGNLYTLQSLTVTDPPASVPEPWGWIGLMLFALVFCGMLRFTPKGYEHV